MICKYCGKPVSGGICTSCKKAVSLSYKSDELSNMLGQGRPTSPPPHTDPVQIRAAYDEGFSAGKNQGYAVGRDAVQKEAFEKNKRRQKLLVFVAAGAMVFIAAICSFAFGRIGFNNGYQQGREAGMQEQIAMLSSDTPVTSTLMPSDEPSPSPTDEPTPSPTDEPTPSPTDEPTPSPTDEPTASPTEEPTASPTEEPALSPTRESDPGENDQSEVVLKNGDDNDNVKRLQERLIDLECGEGKPNGKYGDKTQEAVKAFLEKNNIIGDGSEVTREVWKQIMEEDYTD